METSTVLNHWTRIIFSCETNITNFFGFPISGLAAEIFLQSYENLIIEHWIENKDIILL
jgi:hypothetical protein